MAGQFAPHLTCSGCGVVLTADDAVRTPFRCPRAAPGDNIDHVLHPVGDPAGWPRIEPGELNPFLRYRHRLHSYRVARSRGMSDAEYVQVVGELNESIAVVDGCGFEVTPLVRAQALSDLCFPAEHRGAVWVKDETRNVSGSHKARHLMGIAIYLKVAARLGLVSGDPRLAIASCGNAALAAAVVARAAGWRLEVFVPPWAEPPVVARLRALGAALSVCDRHAGVPGDPCYARFREAVGQGALPFSVQGPDNGLTIEGAETLAWEVVDALGAERLARVFVQVGGGALASAVAQGFTEAWQARQLADMPRLHAVQTTGGSPLARAYDRVVASLDSRTGLGRPRTPEGDAEWALHGVPSSEVDRTLASAAVHRRDFMWPWETEPRSIATGILDDETYDWRAVVAGMIESGGWPLVVSDDELAEANAVARQATGLDVCHTGTAGLAALIQQGRREGRPPGSSLVIFTGAARH